MADLTADEIKFFETGELPAGLAPEPDDGAIEDAAAAAAKAASDAAAAEAARQAALLTTPAQPDAAELLRRSLQEEQTRRIQSELELQRIRAELEAKSKPTVAAPDPATDPLGAMLHQQQLLAQQVNDLQTRLQTEQSNAQLRTQFEQFTASIRAIKEAYEKVVPDFNDAYQHVRNSRAQDLRLTGVPEAQINQTLLQDELNLAQNALNLGRNPAEEVYNMAKRYGYVPKAAPQNGQQKIEALLAAQAADKNPGKGAPPAADITVDSLKDMSSSDLNKVVMNDAQWAKLVGGKSHDIF